MFIWTDHSLAVFTWAEHIHLNWLWLFELITNFFFWTDYEYLSWMQYFVYLTYTLKTVTQMWKHLYKRVNSHKMGLSFLILVCFCPVEPRARHSSDSFVLAAEGHKGLISHLNVDMTTPCPHGHCSVLGGISQMMDAFNTPMLVWSLFCSSLSS